MGATIMDRSPSPPLLPPRHPSVHHLFCPRCDHLHLAPHFDRLLSFCPLPASTLTCTYINRSKPIKMPYYKTNATLPRSSHSTTNLCFVKYTNDSINVDLIYKVTSSLLSLLYTLKAASAPKFQPLPKQVSTDRESLIKIYIYIYILHKHTHTGTVGQRMTGAAMWETETLYSALKKGRMDGR